MAKLTKSFISQTPPRFDSSMLEIGEMMEVSIEDKHNCKVGAIVIKLFNGFILDTEDLRTWANNPKIIGRKLLPGESITLTQE